ncbi:MAG: hypothetical protein AUK53_11835 [Betaproteobacteria bacterium CG2_30_59_46]|nr:MAG: hypothetical protein AUK53_11835 [Betaproteobacteria bacterium CG2_30_59_46]
MEADEWFRIEIVTGLQKLLALRLAGTPPEDAIVGTAEVWLEALWHSGTAWSEHLDRERVRRAFQTLFRICDRWPSPKLLLDNLGSRPQPKALPTPPASPEQIARNKDRLRELIESLTNNLTIKEPRHGNQAKSKSGTLGVPEQGSGD